MNEQGFKLVLDVIGQADASQLAAILKAIDAAGESAASSLTGMEAASNKVASSAAASSAATKTQAASAYDLADAYDRAFDAIFATTTASGQAATAGSQAASATSNQAASVYDLADAYDREFAAIFATNQATNQATSATNQATSAAKAQADADADLAHWLELLAIDERHEAEMARFAADALKEERTVMAASALAARDLDAATKQVAASSDQLNRALAADAADEAAAHAASLRSQLDALGVEAGDVAQAFARGDISARVFARDMDVLDAEAGQLRSKLDSLATATTANASASDKAAAAQSRVGKAAEDGSKGLSQARQGFLDISRASQDLAQGGFGGILNNLEGIGRAIPALLANPLAIFSSLPGLLTIAGTAIFVFGGQVVSTFRKIGEAIGPEKPREFGNEIEKLKAKIDELDKKEVKLPVDMRDLDEAKRKLDALSKAQAAFDSQQGRQSKVEAEAGKGVQTTLDESKEGAEAISQRIKRDLYNESRAANPIIKQAEAEIEQGKRDAQFTRDPGAAASIQKAIDAARTRRDDAERGLKDQAEKQFGAMIDAATKGTGAKQGAAIKFLGDRTGLTFDTAEDVEFMEAGEATVKRKKEAAEEAAKKAAADKSAAKKADDELKRAFVATLTDELDIIKATGDLDKIADALTAKARAAGLEGRAAVERVKEGVDKAIIDALGRQKFEVPIGHEADIEQPIGDLATQAAKAARLRAAAGLKAGDKARNKLVAGQDKQTEKTFEETLKGSGIADEAGAMLAQGQAAGGLVDARGKFQRLDPDQIEAVVRKRVEQWLHRQIGNDQRGRPVFANPNLGGEETGLTAQRILAEGQQEVGRRVAGMAGQQLTNSGKLIAVAGQLNAKLAMQEQQIMQQGQQIAALIQNTVPRARNNRNRGRGG